LINYESRSDLLQRNRAICGSSDSVGNCVIKLKLLHI